MCSRGSGISQGDQEESMIIQPRDRKVLEKALAERLVDPVTLTVFSQHDSGLVLPAHMTCQWCAETVALVQELSQLSDKLSVQVVDFLSEGHRASALGVDKIPAIVVGNSGRIKFYGIPAGYEFASLVEAIVDVSTGRTSLAEATKERLSRLPKEVHIQVFVTPTCPFCPRAVRLAHQMALESPLVRADAIEAGEFPHLIQRYQVAGVPKTVINERVTIEGAVPEWAFLLKVLEAVDALTPEERARLQAQGL